VVEAEMEEEEVGKEEVNRWSGYKMYRGGQKECAIFFRALKIFMHINTQ